MSNKTILVQGTSVAVRADGMLVLMVATKTSPVELEFTPEAWMKLAESARWFKDIAPSSALAGVGLSYEEVEALSNVK